MTNGVANNETTASERERFEAWLRECGYCEFARSTVPETYADNAIHHRWQGWQARAALPAPADQPPSQEPQGSSGSLPESGAEVGTLDAASASVLLDAMQANPRWQLSCEVLKFGKPGKWRVWKLRGNQFHSTDVQVLGEGDTPHEALRAAISTRSKALREAGFTRRPTWKSLPKDGDDSEPSADAAVVSAQHGASDNSEQDQP